MEGWGEVTRITTPGPISSARFDSQSDLIWVGAADGFLKSLTPVVDNYGMRLFPYTSFRGSINEPINSICDVGNRIFSMSDNNIHVSNKRGVPIVNINGDLDPIYNRFDCFDVNDASDIVLSGASGLYKVSTNNPKTFQKYDYHQDVAHIRYQSKFLTLGTTDGGIDLFDHHSNTVVKQFSAHRNGISDMDVQGNYLVSCGYSVRQKSTIADPMINLYDLRMMKLLSPIPYSMGASFVKFHPKLPNIVLIGSKTGQLQLIDIFSQSNYQLYHVDLMNSANNISNLQFSKNGEFIGLTDSYNNTILWSMGSGTSFNNYSAELEHVTALDEPTRYIDVDDNTAPLNSVGMPYYKSLLLSNYGSDLIFTKETAKLPINYDSSLPLLKFMENKFDSNYNKYFSLNQNADNLIPFISDNNLTFDNQDVFKIPTCFLKLSIKYSKFGIEDFNFSLFNSTGYSGLENNLDNSYLNSILQIYKYQSNFQNLILKNLIQEWLPNDQDTIIHNNNPKGSSILNELGYLYDMLNKAKGKNFKISNFSELLNHIGPPELLNSDDLKSVNSEALKRKILRFNQYFITKLIEDFHLQNSSFESFSQLFSLKFVYGNQINFINYVNLHPINIPDLTIGDYLNQSLSNVIELPEILSINANFTNRDLRFLSASWLQEYIFSERTNFVSFTDRPSNYKRYQLLGYVAEITKGPETSIGNHNLVSFVLIAGQWYLFNDFLVMKIDKNEVLDFKKDNKKPLILIYQNYDNLEPFFEFNESNYKQIDDSILYRDRFASTIRDDYIKQYTLLTKGNPPPPGSLVAIDAEFVILKGDQVEINSNSARNLIKPKKLSLARLSVVDIDEQPFIDDYIIHTEHIEDHITSFSGIEPGDLDPARSTKNLVSCQTCYRRLWLLLNIGCVFVGHGLQNDFRIINLHVPKAQIRDTIDLFFLPDFKRKLSLKFLSYVLLGERVQVNNHDSIEDARFALKLYKRYLDLQKTDKLTTTLNHIYFEGQRLKFRVPDSSA